MGNDPKKVKINYGKKDTVPILLNFIPSLLGTDTMIDEATVEVDGKKYRATGSSRGQALENAMKKAMRDRR